MLTLWVLDCLSCRAEASCLFPIESVAHSGDGNRDKVLSFCQRLVKHCNARASIIRDLLIDTPIQIHVRSATYLRWVQLACECKTNLTCFILCGADRVPDRDEMGRVRYCVCDAHLQLQRSSSLIDAKTKSPLVWDPRAAFGECHRPRVHESPARCAACVLWEPRASNRCYW